MQAEQAVKAARAQRHGSRLDSRPDLVGDRCLSRSLSGHRAVRNLVVPQEGCNAPQVSRWRMSPSPTPRSQPGPPQFDAPFLSAAMTPDDRATAWALPGQPAWVGLP